MKSILFADDTVLVQSNNNLGKLQNSVNHEMTISNGLANRKQTFTKYFQNKIYVDVDRKQTCKH